jgi:hypothetical protein
LLLLFGQKAKVRAAAPAWLLYPGSALCFGVWKAWVWGWEVLLCDISTPKGCAKASHRLIASSRHREGIGVVFRATAFDQGEHTA